MPSLWRFLSGSTDGSGELQRIAAASAAATAAAMASIVRAFPKRPGSSAKNGARADELLFADGDPWTAQRLKQTLHSSLRSERIIVVANRQPCIHDRDAHGS